MNYSAGLSPLQIPVNLLSDYDGDDEEWSWG